MGASAVKAAGAPKLRSDNRDEAIAADGAVWYLSGDASSVTRSRG